MALLIAKLTFETDFRNCFTESKFTENFLYLRVEIELSLVVVRPCVGEYVNWKEIAVKSAPSFSPLCKSPSCHPTFLTTLFLVLSVPKSASN